MLPRRDFLICCQLPPLIISDTPDAAFAYAAAAAVIFAADFLRGADAAIIFALMPIRRCHAP